MQEEEIRMPCDASDSLPSVLLRRSRDGGSMWFYHIMQEAFNGPDYVPFRRLQASVPNFEALAEGAVSQNEVNSFVRMKIGNLEQYKEQLAETKRRHVNILSQLQRL